MDLSEHDREVRRDHNKFVKLKARQAREINGKIVRAYQKGIIEERPEAELREELKERFDLTDRQLDNRLEKRSQVGNPKAQALTEARMLVFLERLEGDVEAIRDECDRHLAEIDKAEEEKKEWYDLEFTETEGGKDGNKKVYKRLPLIEARLRIIERSSDALNRFFNAVKSLRGNPTIVQVAIGSGVSELSHEQLKQEIRERELQHKIQDGISGEEVS
jgi:hypothetical protein